MAEYRVKYEIDVAARSAAQAARIAWALIGGQATDPAALPPVLEVQRSDQPQSTPQLIELTGDGRWPLARQSLRMGLRRLVGRYF